MSDKLSPFNFTPEDVQLYKDAAYGTRHEPFINDPATAATFAYSLRSPTVNYGLDFERVKQVPYDQDKANKANAVGMYTPMTDSGWAMNEPEGQQGKTLTHEMWHRGSSISARDHNRANNTFGAAMMGGGLDKIISTNGNRDHDLMPWEQTSLVGQNKGRLPFFNSIVNPTSTGDYAQRSYRARDDDLNQQNSRIEQLRRGRGDFSRTGPK